MSTLVVGIRPGHRDAGVTVCLGAEVLESVTVEGELAIPKAVQDPETRKAVPGNPVALVDTLALVALAGHTWQTAIDIIRDHADVIRARATNPRPLVVVEALIPPRRASAGQGRTLEKLLAQAQNQSALVALLVSEGQYLELVPSDDYDDRDTASYPDALNGPYPKEWRGRKGANRNLQRAAWAIAQAGLAARGLAPDTPVALAVPATPQEYLAALRASVRETTPDTPAAVFAAARHALVTVPRTPGTPDLTPYDIAHDAITRAGVAPHLNTAEGLAALAESAGH